MLRGARRATSSNCEFAYEIIFDYTPPSCYDYSLSRESPFPPTTLLSASSFEFQDTDQFLNLDSILVREKPAWCYMNPKLKQEGGSLEDTGNFLQVPHT